MTPLRPRPFQQVDVFTTEPCLGNPLAVVLDGSGLSDAAMQAFARWTNLSETSFVLPPSPAAQAQGAHYRLRIFTPGGELPFAGHPTLGSCHAWLQASGHSASELLQECGVGLVRIRRSGERLAFAAPPLRTRAPAPALLAQVAEALGLPARQVEAAQWLDNGPQWLTLLLDSAQRVLALDPDQARLKALGVKVGVAHVGPVPADPTTPQVTVRAFAACAGIPEDPVTGSLNASLAQWLMAEGRAPERYLAAQGECLGRAGRVWLERDTGGQVWVGGHSVSCIRGEAWL